jgi:uncharacterized protein YjbI with pentapeptide repeats
MPICPKCLEYNFERPLEAWEQDSAGLCLLHSEAKEKDQDGGFTELIEEKKAKEDYKFTGVFFPGDVSFGKFGITKDVDFKNAIFFGEADFIFLEFFREACFIDTVFC